MSTMKAVYARLGKGIDALVYRDAPIPIPESHEALVRLNAATLNFRDILTVRGQVPSAQEPEYVPLSCGAGEVVAVGGNVTRVKKGDRVTPLFSQGWLSGPKPAPTMLEGPVDGTARQYG